MIPFPPEAAALTCPIVKLPIPLTTPPAPTISPSDSRKAIPFSVSLINCWASLLLR